MGPGSLLLAKTFPSSLSTNDTISLIRKESDAGILSHEVRAVEYLISKKTEETFTIYIQYSSGVAPNKAALYSGNAGCHIIISEGTDHNTSRLIVAHELGHICMHYSYFNGSGLFQCPPEKSIEIENEAWFFAFRLMKEKSDFFREVKTNLHDKFIMTDSELVASITTHYSDYNHPVIPKKV